MNIDSDWTSDGSGSAWYLSQQLRLDPVEQHHTGLPVHHALDSGPILVLGILDPPLPLSSVPVLLELTENRITDLAAQGVGDASIGVDDASISGVDWQQDVGDAST